MRKTKQLKYQNKSEKSLETKIEYTEYEIRKLPPSYHLTHYTFLCAFFVIFFSTCVALLQCLQTLSIEPPKRQAMSFIFSYASHLPEPYTGNHLKGPLLTENNF